METSESQAYPFESNRMRAQRLKLAKIITLLDRIDPDCSYGEWIRVLMGIFHESRGSEEGFNIADDWSSQGDKYKGTKDVRASWRSFKADHPNPITIATLAKMAKGSKKR